jgi:hypothetical protein
MGKFNPVKIVTNAVSSVGSAVGGAFKGINKAVIQPVYNATLKQVPGVDNALKKLDDAVGKAIPGGWGTVAAVGASFIPGAQFAAMGLNKTAALTGLGALSGSGVLRKDGQFNLQGAIMGGALAYGGAKLSEGLQAAGQASGQSANKAVERAVVEGGESALAGTGSAAARGSSAFTPTANALADVGADAAAYGNYYTPTAGQSFAPAAGSDFGLKNVAANASYGGLNPAATVPSGLGTSAAPGFLDSVAAAGSNTLDNIAQAGTGIKNLVGLGAEAGTAEAARTALTNQFGLGSAAALTMGASGLAALEQQKNLLQQQLAEGQIVQAEYDAAVAEIDRSIEVARQAVAENPFKTETDVTGSLSGSGQDKEQVYDTLYDASPAAKQTLYSNVPDRAASSTMYANAPSSTSRSSVYAMGGEVYGAAGSPVGNLGLGSIGPNMGNPNMGYPDNAGTPYGYAEGGEVPGYFLGGAIRKMMPALKSMIQKAASGGSGEGGFSRLQKAVDFIDPAAAPIPAVAAAAENKGFEPAVLTRGLDPATVSIGISSLGRGRPDDLKYEQRNLPIFKPFGFAAGGTLGPDESYNATGPLDNGFSFASGGSPRFLSGGGDGMSDSIKAKINGTQEARLADGEFVIPADVVSHIGNGSSKAGAKQLYSMMDRVRKARVGTKKQGKQINPRKYLAA